MTVRSHLWVVRIEPGWRRQPGRGVGLLGVSAIADDEIYRHNTERARRTSRPGNSPCRGRAGTATCGRWRSNRPLRIPGSVTCLATLADTSATTAARLLSVGPWCYYAVADPGYLLGWAFRCSVRGPALSDQAFVANAIPRRPGCACPAAGLDPAAGAAHQPRGGCTPGGGCFGAGHPTGRPADRRRRPGHPRRGPLARLVVWLLRRLPVPQRARRRAGSLDLVLAGPRRLVADEGHGLVGKADLASVPSGVADGAA